MSHNRNREHPRTSAHLLFRQGHPRKKNPRDVSASGGVTDYEGVDMAQNTEQETLDAYRAEVDRLHAIIAERDEQGRQRTAEGLRERNRADAAEATLARVEALATKFEDRDPHANIPRRSAARLIRDAGVSR